MPTPNSLDHESGNSWSLLFDHLLNHIPANRTVLSGSQVSVVTILKAVQPKDGYGILDYSHGIKQQNSKDLSEREFGEHKWYDPHTGKMDDAGSKSPTTSSTGGLILALQRAMLLLAPQGDVASTFTGPL